MLIVVFGPSIRHVRYSVVYISMLAFKHLPRFLNNILDIFPHIYFEESYLTIEAMDKFQNIDKHEDMPEHQQEIVPCIPHLYEKETDK